MTEDKPTIAVGLESTFDTMITFPDMEAFESFSKGYEDGLSEQVERAYERISSGSGGEEPIDGKREEAEEMLELAKEEGAEIKYSIGGNASQESITLNRLGADAIFLGQLCSQSVNKLHQADRERLDDLDLEFSINFDQYAPGSYILQAPHSERYILAEGEGRRIEQLRPYVRELPATVGEVKNEYGELDAVCVVGVHIVFGNDLTEDDLKLMIDTVEEIREDTDTMLFTDAGGLGGLEQEEKRRISEIFSCFDVLSVNGDELMEVSRSLGFDPENEITAMKKLVDGENDLHTVWMHTEDYQITLSKHFSVEKLKEAEDISALAGLYAVENKDYPDWGDIMNLKESREKSEKGEMLARQIEEEYQNTIDGMQLVASPCYEPEHFVSTVGAGDVSSAGYVYSLTK